MAAGFPEFGMNCFEGRHFDREIIALCVRKIEYFALGKLSFRDPVVEMMAERGLSLAHTTNHALATSLCSRVRAPMGSVCTVGRGFVAGRRDLREDPWQVGLLMQSSRSQRQNSRLSPQHQARCRCSKGVLSQGNQKSGVDAEDHHIRRLCGIASRSARHES